MDNSPVTQQDITEVLWHLKSIGEYKAALAVEKCWTELLKLRFDRDNYKQSYENLMASYGNIQQHGC